MNKKLLIVIITVSAIAVVFFCCYKMIYNAGYEKGVSFLRSNALMNSMLQQLDETGRVEIHTNQGVLKLIKENEFE